MALSAEVDYWLLNANKEKREDEYGKDAYELIVPRIEALREHVLTALFNGYKKED